MFERFTEKAIKVIMLAQEEARRLGHNFVGTEQILIGIVQQKGIVSRAFATAGNTTLKDLRVEMESIIGRGSGFVAIEIPFTPKAKKLLEQAWDISRNMRNNFIGPEHLLLAIIHFEDCTATRILENVGIDSNLIRKSINEQLDLEQTTKAQLSPSIQLATWDDERAQWLLNVLTHIRDHDIPKASFLLSEESAARIKSNVEFWINLVKED